jgi:hypothetical protein
MGKQAAGTTSDNASSKHNLEALANIDGALI